MKDHIQLTKSPKHELNKKGMLRIRDVMYSDSGVYSCVGGLFKRFPILRLSQAVKYIRH